MKIEDNKMAIKRLLDGKMIRSDSGNIYKIIDDRLYYKASTTAAWGPSMNLFNSMLREDFDWHREYEDDK